MIGHDLGGRYEILTRIGGGGMALVYKAHDVLLNRKVAVKVLRQQFVHDEEFIRRFRREAQSAAALSHPNVVSIYDVGQEDDNHYIVMEYVEGQNLNEVIGERAPLQASEAVRIGIQIADALDHAHQNHIIHRDIKPHNILIGNNGRVKVTDFGIARAVTSSTITQTGSVIGSVHYFSPEHAKGINAGEKSDIYSLGIVLYQMLTGKLPFLGESPISVALKHLQEPFEEPRKVNPHIPQSVENVILKAMRKNPVERYGSAHEMLLALEGCMNPDRLNEPKITFTSVNDMEETRVMPAIRAEMLPDAGKERMEAAISSNTDTQLIESEEEYVKPRGWKKPLTVVGVTLLILALIIWGFIWLLGRLDVAEVEVPYVVGRTEAEARQMIEAAGLKVEDPVIHEFNKDVPIDQVISQTKMNMRVKEGSLIQLTVSDGPELEELGDYVGKPIQTAIDELTALGVDDKRIHIDRVFNEQTPETVLQQTPGAGEQFDPETAEFTFMVSKGRETVPMPNLIGTSLDEAKDLLKASELVLEDADILNEPSYIHQKGYVISQNPFEPKEQVVKGSKVSITVSSGPPKDAKEHLFNIVISPAEAGKTSEIRIVYSDARGEDIEWDKRQITGTQTFPVTVVLAPDTEATVTVYRDNQFIDRKSITYEELAQGADSSTLTIPGAEPPPTEEPAQAEVDETDEEANQEEQQQQP
ncbi:Stk1 family PASTA domain-containing Ser/Thr kinase [Paenibacillus sp. N4]|uniref:Stk1 family PASTA domain-containing Ser/Thr kinase n=1 Tax=Paenibacillus vietnamensis TaxID=2590547 RepID=UPI001CD07348|nr:Stk1 family PASTA domain-containing Ser/Thr kinase [Paenibacillus vietnamensis]MCA0753947.1 Stk1 family PASTA domain-containing Ser/Thr kinase [Paenibacillus vietnamensis]